MKKRVYERRLTNVLTESYELCDKCNKRVPEPDNYRVCKFTLEYEVGSEYPGEKNTDIAYIDLCPECVVELLALLESDGYRINERSESY